MCFTRRTLKHRNRRVTWRLKADSNALIVAPSCKWKQTSSPVAVGLRRLQKTVAFVLQYLDRRWAAPPGAMLVLLPPVGQTLVDPGCFWSAAGHPGLTVRSPPFKCKVVGSHLEHRSMSGYAAPPLRVWRANATWSVK